MKYIRKSTLEPTPLGEDEGLVLFDSETGDVHILDGVAADVLTCFETEEDLDKTIEALCQMYDEERSVIEEDVRVFVRQLTEKGLLVSREEQT